MPYEPRKLEKDPRMSDQILHIPVFDADNHLYETEEALTRYLPDAYRRVID